MPQTHNHSPLPTARVATLLMLCPLLAVSDSVINALGLGIVAVIVTVVASVPLSIGLERLSENGRIAVVVSIIGAVVTSTVLIANAYFYKLYAAIGSFLPLLLAGGLLIARNTMNPDTAPVKRRPLLLEGLRTGLIFAAVLLLLGTVREFVGHGSLLFGADAVPFVAAERFTFQAFNSDLGFVLAALPPGAFIAMGILFAVRNWVRQRSGKQ